MSDMLEPRPFLKRVIRPKCPVCGGWDVGAVGLIMHRRDCPDHPDREYFDHLDEEHERG